MASATGHSNKVIEELREFAKFPAYAQRNIRMSLDVYADVVNQTCFALDRWSRDINESAHIAEKRILYRLLPKIRELTPKNNSCGEIGLFIGECLKVSSFDIMQGRIDSFNQFQFLYERMLGASARPWLTAIYLASSSLPMVSPQRISSMLYNITNEHILTKSWSSVEPKFYPQNIDRVQDFVE